MDVFSFIYAVELAKLSLLQTRISWIDDCGVNRFVLWFTSGNARSALVVSVSPEKSGLLFVQNASLINELNENNKLESQQHRDKTDRDSNFVKALRFHLRRAELLNIEHIEGERRAEFFFESKTEFGKRDKRTLVVEIMGRHSGAYLLGGKRTVLSVARKYTTAHNRFRRVSTGKPYPPPPPLSKPSAWGITQAELTEVLQSVSSNDVLSASQLTIKKALLNALTGVDKRIADYALSKAGVQGDISIDEILKRNHIIEAIALELRSLTLHKNLRSAFGVNQADEFERISLLELLHEGEQKKHESNQEANSSHYGRRRASIQRELGRLQSANAMDKIAEWMTVAKSECAYGTYEIFEKAKEMSIELNCDDSVIPILNKAEDIDRASLRITRTAARYRKAFDRLELKSADNKTEENENIVESREQSAELEPLIKEQSSADISKRYIELVSLKKLGVRHRLFNSSDGTPIVVGLDAKSNDALLKRFGSTSHWWFHSRDVPGSWVIALTGRAQITDATRVDAAIVAAAHSQDKNELSVDVSYTQMKYLRKPKGAKAGMVLMQFEKTMTVNPSEFQRIKDRIVDN